jgi:hypothetical protein
MRFATRSSRASVSIALDSRARTSPGKRPNAGSAPTLPRAASNRANSHDDEEAGSIRGCAIRSS